MYVLKEIFGMKSSSVRWQFSPVRDSTLEGHQMPGVNRSDREALLLSNLQMSGKMPSTNLLRLNSVGEVSAESFPETTARKGKLGFSKSLDSVTSSKSFSAGHPVKMSPSASFMGHSSGYTWGNNTPFSTHHFSTPNMFSHPYSLQFGVRSINHSMFPNSNCYRNMSGRGRHFSPQNGHANSLLNFPYPPRLPGLLPGAMFTAMSAFPESGKILSHTRSNLQGDTTNQACTTLQNNYCSVTNKDPQALHVDSEAQPVAYESETTDSASHEPESVSKKLAKSIENISSGNAETNSTNTMIEVKDSTAGKLEVSVFTDTDEFCNSDKKLTRSSQKENNLKRRNDKHIETMSSSPSNSNCSLASVINDLSSVLFLRKTPKKNRPSCKKRKKRQLQKQAGNPQPSNSHDVKNTVCESIQPLCSSPATSSITFMPTSSPIHASNSPNQSPSKPRPSCVANLFCQPDSDSEFSDIDDCDSMKLSCDFPKSLSPLNNLGSALSLDNLFKPKSLPRLDTLLKDNSKCDLEHNSKADSPAPSPGPTKSLHFSFSFSVSEEDDSDRSFDSFSSSPSDQLILDFGFGLSLETIIGKRTETSFHKEQCADDEKQSSEVAALLLKVNADWNKNYPSLPCISPFNNTGKVQFASDTELVEIHVVGNEERRGTWFEDGQRFKKRIDDVGKVISYVFDDDHRQKICQKFGLNS